MNSDDAADLIQNSELPSWVADAKTLGMLLPTPCPSQEGNDLRDA